MNQITVVGTGSGTEEYILPCAKNELMQADFVIASERVAGGLGLTGTYKFSGVDETVSLCRELLGKGNVAVAVSGDPLMYSFLKTLQNMMPDEQIRVIPSVGAVQLMGARFGVTLEDAKIISIHGRDVGRSGIVSAVSENRKVFFYCDSKHSPSYIAKVLDENRLGNVKMYVGANLTYENETAEQGTAAEMAEKEYPSLVMALVVNDDARRISRSTLLADSEFERTCAPMTKEEIRAVVMLKLGIKSDDVIWDIGAGTGSVSVECARSACFGRVYSVEKNDDALRALELNKNKFGLENMHITAKNAAEAIKELPVPDVIFIGGTGGEFKEVFNHIENIGKKIRVVMTAVTLETKAEAYEMMKRLDRFDAVEISASRSKAVGSYTVMEPNNAVMILSGYTKNLE